MTASASAPTSTWPARRRAARPDRERRPRRRAPAPIAQASGGFATRSTAPAISARAAVDAQRHAPGCSDEAVRAGVVEAQRVAVAGAQPGGVARIRRARRDGEHRQDRRALARPGAVRVELERGCALQVEHLDDARAVAAQHEVRAVGGDRGVRAGRLGEHDVALVVHEALDRVRGGARGQRQQREQRRRARGARVIPRRPRGTRRRRSSPRARSRSPRSRGTRRSRRRSRTPAGRRGRARTARRRVASTNAAVRARGSLSSVVTNIVAAPISPRIGSGMPASSL